MTLSSSRSPKLPRKRFPQADSQASNQVNSPKNQVIPLSAARSKTSELYSALPKSPQKHTPISVQASLDRPSTSQVHAVPLQQVSKSSQIKLQRIVMIKKSLATILLCLGTSIIGVNGYQQKLTRDWNQNRLNLEKLRKNERELTAMTATLDHYFAREITRNLQGYQPENLTNVLILPKATGTTNPNAKSQAKSTSKPYPNGLNPSSNPSAWLTAPNNKPLAY